MGRVVTGRPPRRPVHVLGVEPAILEDPGDGGAIATVTAAFVRLKSAHAGPGETRTLVDPVFFGQQLDLYFEADGGAITITAATAVNQSAKTTLLFEDGGDHIELVGACDGLGGLAWRVVCNDGVTLGP